MFERKINISYDIRRADIHMKTKLPMNEINRILDIESKWAMYEGYHWEGLEEMDKAEVTLNYSRKFVDKQVAFELGKAFNIKMKPAVEPIVLGFLNDVWDDHNSKEAVLEEFGQIKSVTGKVWLKVEFIGKDHPDYDDPYGEYPLGYIKLIPMLPSIIFPEYSKHDRKKLTKLTVLYTYTDANGNTVVYSQEWTKEEVIEFINGKESGRYSNKYGVIPFFPCDNLTLAGKVNGKSDLEDIIPINSELNFKASDMSEIIDYHSAPVTVVFGANADELEKGANKVWSGLPKDAKVENLALESDLSASKEFIEFLKEAMHEIGSVPEIALGKMAHISNTSGVALEIAFGPLIETVRSKRALTSECITEVNKFIIHVGLTEGLIDFEESKEVLVGDSTVVVTKADLFKNEIVFGDSLAKDGLIELQKIQIEMKLGLCDREEAMKRLGKKDIQTRIKEIDTDRAKYPDIYGALDKGEDIMNRGLNENGDGDDSTVNAGLQNSPEPKK